MDKAREAAINVLYDVHVNGAYANVALVRVMRKYALSDIDRRFATELVYGVVKAGDTIDWILTRYISRPIKKIPFYIREILRLGLYQLFFLDKVPASAVCNEAVELAKKYGHKGTAGFVNAVLRTAAREPEKAAFPEGEGKKAQSLALRSQHPEWLIKSWIKEFGYNETVRLCEYDNLPAKLSIRANTLKISRDELLAVLRLEGVEAVPSAWSPDGIVCLKYPALDSLESLKNGLFQVQDESSMQVAAVVAPKPGEFIIDACSAPGGKATHLAALMANKGRILALDIYEAKLARVRDNAARLGISIIETSCLDARGVGDNYMEMADRVLVDAPCSGLGVLRRKPDSRWRKTQAEIEALPKLQLEILVSASKAVKAGGVLVYSTCTINQKENSLVVERFLSDSKGFVLEKTGSYLPVRKTERDLVQFYPQQDNIDGFFIARMRKLA